MGVEPPLQESLRGRHRVVLRPRGRSRFVVVGFLSVWLVGWAAGEVFAVGTLLRLLPPQESAPPALFLGLWLTLWTVGGLGALAALLQQVLGREELEWSSERLTVKRRFRQDVALHRDELDDLVLTGRELTLSARTRTGTVPLVTLGTRQERTELRDELRRVLDLGHRVVAAVPPGWREVQDSTGRLVLEASRGPTLIGGGALWLLSAWPALKAVRALRRDAALDALLWTLVVLLALGAGLAALLSRRELLMAPGRLTLRKSGLRSSLVTIALEGLAVRVETDSDGDEWVALVAFGEARELELVRRQNDAEAALVLGRRLAVETGARLSLAPELESRLGMAPPTASSGP